MKLFDKLKDSKVLGIGIAVGVAAIGAFFTEKGNQEKEAKFKALEATVEELKDKVNS